MTTFTKTVGAASIALLALTGAASAEDRTFGYTWTVTGASDYLFRGISFTDNEPTINSYLELTYGIAYLGFWTSNIGGNDGGSYGPWEQDIYAGIRPVTGPVNWDLGVLYYTYGGKNGASSSDLDYVEFQIIASYSPIKNLTLTGKGYYTPDQGGASPVTGTAEGAIAYALPQVGIFSPTLSGGIGYTEADKDAGGWFLGEDDYTYWNAGIKLGVEKFSFDFRYWDTSIDTNVSDERFLFTASVTLP